MGGGVNIHYRSHSLLVGSPFGIYFFVLLLFCILCIIYLTPYKDSWNVFYMQTNKTTQ